MADPKDLEMIGTILALMIDKAVQNRELAQSAQRDRIAGTFDQTKQRSEASKKPKRRKVSKYAKEFGKQLKKLKKKHPRTKVMDLMARAHTATRKQLKMPRKRRRA